MTLTGNRRTLLLIGAGSALGGCLRYATAGMLAAAGLTAWPWATLIVNALGSFGIGWFAAATGPRGRMGITASGRHFMMTGLFGGFTTFSVFGLETVALLESGRALAAGANILATTGICLFAVELGHRVALGPRGAGR